jgi:hypothetical protein
VSRPGEVAGTGLTRRQFGAAAVAVAGTVGYAGAASTQPRETVVERDGWQVSEVRVERQFTFVGASALLYNEGGSAATARIRFRLYRPNGRLEFERTVDARVPGGEERHVATWWELDVPGTTTPLIESVDAEIVGVQG